MSVDQLQCSDRVDDLPATCVAPSCWDDGRLVLLQGDAIATVLCETHRKAYLGVST